MLNGLIKPTELDASITLLIDARVTNSGGVEIRAKTSDSEEWSEWTPLMEKMQIHIPNHYTVEAVSNIG